MKIRVFTTGGTFDKEYDPVKQELVLQGTCVPKLLKHSRCNVEYLVTPLMAIDSLDMKTEHRLLIADACRKAEEKRIIITHGTDTIVETAKVLAKEVKGKTIVLMGALVPYELRNSDSLFNLGAAIAFVQCLPFGVYIAMNGAIFFWGKVKKNPQTGVFEEV